MERNGPGVVMTGTWKALILRIAVECLSGLFWALLVLLTLYVHYILCVDVPEFRYVGF
jgi:hypothetical protein